MNDEAGSRLPTLISGGIIRPIVPQTFEEAWRIAKAVVVAGMNPKGLDSAEKCTVVILHGLEVGMPPMMALQSIALINGRPTIYGDGALGLVQGSGKLVTIKEWIEGTGDNRVAFCRVMRANDPEPKIGSFSVADAKTAKLWMKKGRQGEDTPWVTYPERMLKMRARGWALRDGFADVLKGLAIGEEIRDIASDVSAPTPLTPPKPPETKPDPVKGAEQTLGQKPVSSTTKMELPKPPKPQMKEIIDDEVPDFDPETGEVFETVQPGDLLTELDVALSSTHNSAEIEELWNELDPMAKLESLPLGEEFTGVAMGIKRRHLKRVEE